MDLDSKTEESSTRVPTLNALRLNIPEFFERLRGRREKICVYL
jgi:hypothetical protein